MAGHFFRDAGCLFTQASLKMKLSGIKLRREIVWPFLLAGTITWCSGFPATLPSFDLFQVDKLGHFAAYGALATTLVRIEGLRRWALLGGWWALLFASAYGLGDEFRQSLTHGIRQYDLDDWMADTIGAIVATVLYLRWAWYRRLMEIPVGRKRPATAAAVASESEPAVPAADEKSR